MMMTRNLKWLHISARGRNELLRAMAYYEVHTSFICPGTMKNRLTWNGLISPVIIMKTVPANDISVRLCSMTFVILNTVKRT